MDGPGTGQRIARARRRRGMSQAVLAGLAGRSESWLSQVERGKRGVDSHAVLTRLAAVLRVDVEDLTGRADEAPQRRFPLAGPIERAMIGYPSLGTVITGDAAPGGRDGGHLAAAADAARRDYQATRYEQAGARLARLIRDAEQASRAAGHGSAAISGALALVYDTTAALLSRVGESALAWAAADRAMAAAEASGEPLLTAAAAWRLSYMLTGRRHPREALDLAMSAAAATERLVGQPKAELLSVHGALHLAGATAAAASYDEPAARACLEAAGRDAARLGGDANWHGTAFGPVNVTIHTMSAALRLGDARAAITAGEALDPESLPPGLTGRRAQVRLDLARGYAMRRQDAAAVNALLDAERLSPQLVRFDPATRDVLTSLLRREHRPSTPALRPLARRAGVI